MTDIQSCNASTLQFQISFGRSVASGHKLPSRNPRLSQEGGMMASLVARFATNNAMSIKVQEIQARCAKCF
jgi:hypothetical protein